MTDEVQQRDGIAARWVAAMRRHRFDLLLAALVLLLLWTPVARLLAPERNPLPAQVTVTLLFSLMLLSAVFAVCQTRRSVAIALALVLPGIALHQLRLLVDWDGLLALGHVFSICFLGYTILVILRYLFTCERVSFNTICASLCVYLLLGVLWAGLYSLINIIDPDSFALAFAENRGGELMRFGARNSIYPIYYSFVTLSTLGYGDIIPISSAARMFAAVEAITGQLYLAVLVARLVGLHISQSASVAQTRPDGTQRHRSSELER